MTDKKKPSPKQVSIDGIDVVRRDEAIDSIPAISRRSYWKDVIEALYVADPENCFALACGNKARLNVIRSALSRTMKATDFTSNYSIRTRFDQSRGKVYIWMEGRAGEGAAAPAAAPK